MGLAWFSSDARRVQEDPPRGLSLPAVVLVERPLGRHQTSRSEPQHSDHGSQASRDPLAQEIADLKAGRRVAGGGRGRKGEGGAEETKHLPSNLTLRGFRYVTIVRARRGEEGMRFTTREPTSGVISRLEGVAARVDGRYRVSKSGPTGVRLEGEELGRKERLVAAAKIFAVAPSVLVVVIRKDASDTLEYRSFCINELRPTLQDIVWAASNSQTTIAV